MAQDYATDANILTDAHNKAKANQLNSLYDNGQTNVQAGQTAGGLSAADSLRNRYNTVTQTAQQTMAAPAEDTAAETPAEEAAETPAATPAVAAARINGTAAGTTENRTQAINDMYAAQQAARLAELENAYNTSMSDMQAAADKIPGQYQTQANANAVDYERQRRNWLEGANMNGINTGSAAQWQLSMMGQGQRNLNNIRTSQAAAQAEAARQQANLTAQYQSNISQALANNDYQKAAALLDEYNNGFERDLKTAAALSEYGDFSGYAALYGDDVAQGMADIWAQQNPDVAYVTGRVTKDQRDNIKAGRPINDGLDENGVRVVAAGGGGGGGWHGSTSDILRQQLNSDYYGTNGSSPNTAEARGDRGVVTQSAYNSEMSSLNRF